jgi:hypothetical protein
MAAARAQEFRKLQVYVDPVNGSDSLALARNPTGAGTPQVFQTHAGDPFAITGELQHVPYAFKTVTAALNWLNSLPVSGAQPYSNPTTQLTLDQAIVHCLPGLYGPKQAPPPNDEQFDVASGLPWNGETFPLNIPARVSIQGTSALDTIFDARGGVGPIFKFRPLDFAGSLAGEIWNRSFVDSVAMRGCRAEQSAVPGHGAAVFIDAHSNSSLHFQATVSNCFIYGNDVGIAVRNSVPDPESSARPRILMNTIAWKSIGIYAEDGATPMALNNLIDPIRPVATVSTPFPSWLVNIAPGAALAPSCFEGLGDVHVAGFTACVAGLRNYNAYHTGLVNTGANYPAWIQSLPPALSLTVPPVVDLAPIVGAWPPTGRYGRAAIFVADTVEQFSPFAGTKAGLHDLRLAPMVHDAAPLVTDPNLLTFYPNPMVNQGISSGYGHPSVAPYSAREDAAHFTDDLASFTPWDWDCEGVGNPREASRSMCNPQQFFPEPFVCAGRVDLGADEMGELIVAGYYDGTRILSAPHHFDTSQYPANAANLGSSRALYLNVHCGTPLDLTLYPGPQYNFRTDAAPITAPEVHPKSDPEWFAQLGETKNPFTFQAAPYGFTEGKHVNLPGTPVTKRAALTNTDLPTGVVYPPGANPYPHFLRNRLCDFSPHLADDIQTGSDLVNRKVDYAEYLDFTVWFVPAGGWVTDAFKPNAWYSAGPLDYRPDVNDNKFLYGDRSVLTLKHLRSGTIAPPLVVANEDLQTLFPKSFLFRNPTHPILVWEPFPFTYSIGVQGWGTGTTTVPPAFSNMSWYGIRFNLELFDPDNPFWVPNDTEKDFRNNVQTFLSVNSLVAEPPAPPLESRSAPAVFVEFEQQMMRSLLGDLRRRGQR